MGDGRNGDDRRVDIDESELSDFGRELLAIRRRIEASDAPLSTGDEIDEEVRRMRTDPDELDDDQDEEATERDPLLLREALERAIHFARLSSDDERFFEHALRFADSEDDTRL